ncbi:MAG TPA: glycosyl hydrolase family 18 protein [bacterium]|nr:glycosyl hydrolase family 18 protein [bacterium]
MMKSQSPLHHGGTETRRKAGGILLAALLLLPVCLHAQTQVAGPKKKGPVAISGWVTFWDQGHKSVASFVKHANQIDRAYFEWYHLSPDGMPAPVTDATGDLKAQVMAAAKKGGCETWWMIGNYNVAIGAHDAGWVEKFLNDGDLRKRHIQQLIDYGKADGVEGIQIDYEELKAEDKAGFSNFMAELGKACQANGFKLGIAAHAKVDANGTWGGPQAQDYHAIGGVVQQFMPMTYDLHWSTSGPGCVTAPEWAETCIKYAASVIPAPELEIGYPVYGYDWVGTHGDTLTWSGFQDLLQKYKLTPVRDNDYSQELKINYTDDKNQQHEAWIPDSQCLEAQANVVKRNKLYGLGVWYFGAEDESFWTTMAKINGTTEETHFFTSGSPNVVAETSAGPLPVKDLISEKAAADYSYAYPEGSKIVIVDKQGKRWVDVSLKGTAWSGFGVGMSRKNLLPYRQSGALQFYIRGAKGGETNSVCFIMEKGMQADEKYNLVSEVQLSDYCKVTTQWQLVTIPLSDFPENGYHHDDATGAKITGPFKWERVLEFGGNHTPTADANCEMFFSSVRIIPSYDAKAVEKAKFRALQ